MPSLYHRFKEWVMRFLKVPPEPQDPLGEHKSLQVFRASPGYYRYKLWGFKIRSAFTVLIGGALVIGIFLFAVKVGGWAFILLLLGGCAVAGYMVISIAFSYALLRLDYEMRWYKVTDRSLRVREGVVNVHEMTMTFDNIQNISIHQGPIQRYFNIADLKVDSAGGGGGLPSQHHSSHFNMHNVFFRGVENGEEIRQLILNRLKEFKTSGLGDADEAAALSRHSEETFQENNPALDILKEIRREAALFRQAAERIAHKKI